MRNAKLGDVYAVKVPNGIKIVQWGYHIKKYGRFIRVFDGLYQTVPSNIEEIVSKAHSYIIDLFVSRAYRIGLLDWLGNYPVPEEYPFPDYMVEFNFNRGKVFQITIMKTLNDPSFPQRIPFPVTSISELPEPYRNVTLLNSSVSPDWLLYLFDNGFSLDNPSVFYPAVYWGSEWEKKYQVYIDMVVSALEKDPRSKSILKAYLE